MFFPRKAFLCPQEEARAKEFSGSSCHDSPLSTHLPLPSKVFAQVIFLAKFALAYFCSLFLHCFPLECQSLFFTLSLLTVLMFVLPRYIWYINKIWSPTSRNIMNKLQRIIMQATVPQSQCNYPGNQSSDEGVWCSAKEVAPWVTKGGGEAWMCPLSARKALRASAFLGQVTIGWQSR